MKTLKDRQIEQLLTSRRPEPPRDLLDKIKNEIPADLDHEALPELSPSDAGMPSRRLHWMLAAALVSTLGASFIAWQLRQDPDLTPLVVTESYPTAGTVRSAPHPVEPNDPERLVNEPSENARQPQAEPPLKVESAPSSTPITAPEPQARPAADELRVRDQTIATEERAALPETVALPEAESDPEVRIQLEKSLPELPPFELSAEEEATQPEESARLFERAGALRNLATTGETARQPPTSRAPARRNELSASGAVAGVASARDRTASFSTADPSVADQSMVNSSAYAQIRQALERGEWPEIDPLSASEFAASFLHREPSRRERLRRDRTRDGQVEHEKHGQELARSNMRSLALAFGQVLSTERPPTDLEDILRQARQLAEEDPEDAHVSDLIDLIERARATHRARGQVR